MKGTAIIDTKNPIFSVDEKIAWINGEAIKITENTVLPIIIARDNVADFSFVVEKSDSPPPTPKVVQQKQNVDIYLSDEESPPQHHARAQKKPIAPKAPAPVVAVPAAMAPAALPVYVPPARPAHVPLPAKIHAKQAPAHIPPAALETEEEKENKFWNAITKLSWRNKSDGVMDINRINKEHAKAVSAAVFYMRTDFIKAIVADNECYSGLSDQDKQKIVYHIVLLGRDWFENIINSPDLINYLVMSEEVQQFSTDDIDKLIT